MVQMDKDPNHSAKANLEFVKVKKVKILQWPSESKWPKIPHWQPASVSRDFHHFVTYFWDSIKGRLLKPIYSALSQ